MSQKSFTQSLADLNALYTSGNDIPAVSLQPVLANLIESIKAPLKFPEVAAFEDIDAIPTAGLLAGTVIEVVIRNQRFVYILKAGNKTTLASMFRQPIDYAKPGNEKYWQIANVIIESFDAASLIENKLTITHNSGYKFVPVNVFTSNFNQMPVVATAPESGQFRNILLDEDSLELEFHSTLTGTLYYIIHL